MKEYRKAVVVVINSMDDLRKALDDRVPIIVLEGRFDISAGELAPVTNDLDLPTAKKAGDTYLTAHELLAAGK